MVTYFLLSVILLRKVRVSPATPKAASQGMCIPGIASGLYTAKKLCVLYIYIHIYYIYYAYTYEYWTKLLAFESSRELP